MVADDASREADQDRHQGRSPRSQYLVPDGGGRHTTNPVRGDPAIDRQPAAKASADMTPRVVAAVGLNWRALDYLHLPDGRLLAPDCALAGSRARRLAQRRPSICSTWSRFRSMPNYATVFGAWEESSGKSRLTCAAGFCTTSPERSAFSRIMSARARS